MHHDHLMIIRWLFKNYLIDFWFIIWLIIWAIILIICLIIWYQNQQIIKLMCPLFDDYLITWLTIWLMIWLMIWCLCVYDSGTIIWLFDYYWILIFWLFDCCLMIIRFNYSRLFHDYLMIILVQLFLLFDDYSFSIVRDYLMKIWWWFVLIILIIWCLFDNYLFSIVIIWWPQKTGLKQMKSFLKQRKITILIPQPANQNPAMFRLRLPSRISTSRQRERYCSACCHLARILPAHRDDLLA